jgi:hypothetical protein
VTIVPGTIHDDDGALTEVQIFPSASVTQPGAAMSLGVSALALFDTGSEVTFIQKGLAAALGIFPHEVRDIPMIGNQVITCDVFVVTIAFPSTPLVINDLWVAEAEFESYSRSGVRLIIGRSVLRKGTFTYNGWDQLFTFEVASP